MKPKGVSKMLLAGVGICDAVEDPAISGEMHAYAYNAWTAMLRRCYSPVVHAKQPTYVGCTVCPEWLHFSAFRAWFVQNYKPGYQLDKDILMPGNKIYAPDRCVLVPKYINTILLDSAAARGAYPVGVHWNTGHQKFSSRCSLRGRRISLGYFDTPEEAAAMYRVRKAAIVKQVARAAYGAGEISHKVKLALCRRKF